MWSILWTTRVLEQLLFDLIDDLLALFLLLLKLLYQHTLVAGLAEIQLASFFGHLLNSRMYFILRLFL